MIEMTIVKRNGALNGFNQWTLNGEAFSMDAMKPMYTVYQGHRYRSKSATPVTTFTRCICIGTVSN